MKKFKFGLGNKGIIKNLGLKDLPDAPPMKKLFGPSFILLGLGLGSGEIVLWPYMASNHGLGIVWGMFAGLTMQFFINMEVSRYALINGESIFVGFARLIWWLPLWFILSTFLGFAWPGIGLYGASLVSAAIAPNEMFTTNTIGCLLFVLIGIILSLGKILYKTVEQLQKIMIAVCVPWIIGLTYYLAPKKNIILLSKGLMGFGEANGEQYLFLPTGIALGTFLGAIAYAGAGGNLNLTQSCYVRDKGYGMGKYADKITGLFTSNKTKEFISITGNTFPLTTENIKKYHNWWKAINWEHFIVFWVLGFFTMLTLSLLAFTTSSNGSNNLSGINFILNEARTIGAATLPIFEIAFLLVLGVMLCATQLTVLDSTTRIITENLILLKKSREKYNISKRYYLILWLQIIFGISVFTLGFDQPMSLIILGAVINAFSMFIYTGILLWLNNRVLAHEFRPSFWRNSILVFTFIFFGTFFTIITYLEIIKH